MERFDSDWGPAQVISRADLSRLVAALEQRGYAVIGPRVSDGAVICAPIHRADDLPVGVREEQEGGRYRLIATPGDPAVFAHTVGPQTWKRYLYPPRQRLFQAKSTGGSFRVEAEPPPEAPYAFFGVRACDLQAMAAHDVVFGVAPPAAAATASGTRYTDSGYRRRRAAAFVVAVQCGQAGGTCFCVSQNAGPRAESGFDLALTEILEGEHRFLMEIGSDRGAEVVAGLSLSPASTADRAAAEAATARAVAGMGRSLPGDTPARLKKNLQSSHWNTVGQRCLNCANCTMVCPTCFCSSVEDTTDLAGQTAERWRRWDSCFTLDFSYIHGGSLRQEGGSRYRQWISHKLAHWHDQFGTSGCTGCGRCITWCPVGIDITAEVAALDPAGDTTAGQSCHGEGEN